MSGLFYLFKRYIKEEKDYKSLLPYRKQIDRLLEALAEQYLSLFWGEVKEKFPNIASFSVTTDYRYNDNYYDLAFEYRVSGNPVYSLYEPDNHYGDYDESSGEDIVDMPATELIWFWENHQPLFHQLFGEDYEFHIGPNGVTANILKRPDHVILTPERW